jgi:hypothetical protein
MELLRETGLEVVGTKGKVRLGEHVLIRNRINVNVISLCKSLSIFKQMKKKFFNYNSLITFKTLWLEICFKRSLGFSMYF